MAERTIEYERDERYMPQADVAETRSETAESPAFVSPRRTGALRRDLSTRNLQRAVGFAHEATYGSVPSVVYQPSKEGTHGNFFPASYRRMLAHPAWAERLEKAYTASHRIAHSKSRSRRELDCAASSDALLMNIFCHPTALRSTALQALLDVDGTPPEFGVRAHVPLRCGNDDRTEIDMRLQALHDTLLVEAKLSETDFQTARPALMDRYEAFPQAFLVDALPRRQGHFCSYQLLRSVLAAEHHRARFAVLLDARRTDLLEDTFQVFCAVRHSSLRSRLHVVTWQEIAACVPRTLQTFLREKYGIEAAH